MNRLTDIERKKALIDEMGLFDEQIPCVGVFQYYPVDHRFVLLQKNEITPQVVEEDAERGKPFVDFLVEDSKLGAEDNHFGSVVWSIDKFMVFVGKLAEPIQE